MATALITGIEGFTGPYLAAELEREGYDVVGLSRVPHDLQSNVVEVDLLDAARVQEVIAKVQPNYVAHLAAVSFVANQEAAPYYQVNVVGTNNLLRALASVNAGVEGVLLCSSAAVYGRAGSDAVDESAQVLPISDYGVSKLAMEHMARLWFERLPITMVRPFNYTGVGQSTKFLVAKIADHFRRRETRIQLGNIDVSRDFSDVRWVARKYRQLLEAGAAGEIFNVCSGSAKTIRDIIRHFEELCGYQIEVESTAELKRAADIPCLVGKGDKLAERTGGEPAIALETTLDWMLRGNAPP